MHLMGRARVEALRISRLLCDVFALGAVTFLLIVAPETKTAWIMGGLFYVCCRLPSVLKKKEKLVGEPRCAQDS